MANKDILIRLIERGNEEEHILFGQLTDEERSFEGGIDHWSAKDLFAHNAAWKKNMANNLEAISLGKPAKRDKGINLANAEIFTTHHNKSWGEVLAFAEEAFAHLLKQVDSLSDETLKDTTYLPWQQERPLWRLIVGNGYLHPITHLAEFYIRRGNTQYAFMLYESAIAQSRELDNSPNWIGILRYNLACSYALSGHKADAIATLRQALRLNPDLTEWSKEDPDFSSLRQDPEYQAIYNE